MMQGVNIVLAVTVSLLVLVALVVTYFVLKGRSENTVPDAEGDNQLPTIYHASNLSELYSEGYPED